jgi:polygalacturonase
MRHTKVFIAILFFYLVLSSSKNAAQVFLNVKDFGARGNGTALDSKAINKAIETAAKAGGGTIYLPAGNYLCGSIRLKNNISFFIDQGAIIIAAPVSAKNDYDEEEPGAKNKFQDMGH